MDALFEDAPIFVANTEFAKAKDHRAAERELRDGQISFPLNFTLEAYRPIGTFVPGGLTGRGGMDDLEAVDEKQDI